MDASDELEGKCRVLDGSAAREEKQCLDSSILPVHAAHRMDCHKERELKPSINVDEHVFQTDPSVPQTAAVTELAAAVDLHQRGKVSDALLALYSLCRNPSFEEFPLEVCLEKLCIDCHVFHYYFASLHLLETSCSVHMAGGDLPLSWQQSARCALLCGCDASMRADQ